MYISLSIITKRQTYLKCMYTKNKTTLIKGNKLINERMYTEVKLKVPELYYYYYYPFDINRARTLRDEQKQFGLNVKMWDREIERENEREWKRKNGERKGAAFECERLACLSVFIPCLCFFLWHPRSVFLCPLIAHFLSSFFFPRLFQ